MLTKQEAIAAMVVGKKITHQYFAPDEFIFIENGDLKSEDGVNHGNGAEFWKYRTGPEWQTGWEIYNSGS